MAVDLEHQVVMTSVYFDHEIHRCAGDRQIEAVFTNVTYGTRPYFGTGLHMDSEQAVKDGSTSTSAEAPAARRGAGVGRLC
jgi:hypothetical protein